MNPGPGSRSGCERVRGRLERWLDGALAPLDEALDRGHLEACASCAREAERWEKLLRGIRTLSAREPGPVATRAAIDFLGRSRPRSNRPRGIPIPVPWLGVAAALLVLLALQLGGLGPPPAVAQVRELAALDQVLERLPSWSELLRGLESLSRRLS